MTTYTQAPDDVREMMAELIGEYHPALAEVNVRLDVLLAFAPAGADGEPKGPALKVGGYPAAGMVRVLSLKDRTAGRGDAEIVLDGDRWKRSSHEERRALADHELEHLIVRTQGPHAIFDDDGRQVLSGKAIVNGVEMNWTEDPLVDDLNRPRLRLKRHDLEMGLFHSVAKRHGKASIEVQQIRRLQDERGQIYLFAELAPAGSSVVEMRQPERRTRKTGT